MANIKIKFIGIPNVKRFYKGAGITCDTKKKSSCIVDVGADQAAQLMIDFPKEWEYITNKGAEVIGKEITDYQNKIISLTRSTKGFIAIKEKPLVKPVIEKPKEVIEEKPLAKPDRFIPKKPKRSRGKK